MRGQIPRWRWVAAGSSALLAVGCVVCALTWAAIFDSVIASRVALSPTSAAYSDWLAPSVPIYFDVYLFNWTNADMFPEEIPKMEQIGPYKFKEYRRHVNVSFHPHNDSVAYRTQRSWQFDDSGPGKLDDVITTIDMISASAVFTKRYDNPVLQSILAISLAATGHKLYVSKTARELLFDGYDDPLLVTAKYINMNTKNGPPQLDKFGWFYERNNSMDTEGHIMVSTGLKSGTLPGQIIEWNFNNYLPFYDGECSKMEGSVGEFMPRNLTEDMRLTMFLSDLCRTVHMDYVDSGDINGLPYHKYALTANSFDNSSLVQDNTCFCNGECAWGGVMNVSACRFGAPIFLSLPHFLHGDAKLHELVHGLEPDPDKHSFYFAVEPRMGVPLDVAGRFQLNVYLEPNPNIALFANVPRMLLPCFWVEQHVLVNHTVIEDIKVGRRVLDWGGTICAFLALFFGAIVTMATCCFNKKSKYSPPTDNVDKPKEIVDESEMKLNPI